TRSFCYVSDLIDGIIRIARHNTEFEVLNLGNDEEYSIIELAKTILELTGCKNNIIHLPPQIDDPVRRKPDISKARRLLDWHPKVDLRSGL
ncbi:MAG: SDR family NAD-dependent epimerase/dehydratase, partial [Deltaproteobacteria bacterium]|nr:SDR family NAD-dependent epimerase/dehydratase [Deltaproteobacteria bacterium]